VPSDQFAAVLVKQWRDSYLPTLAIDAFQSAVKEAISPAVAVTAIADLVEVGVERTSRHLVE
jgi:hypothetical protein